MSVESAESERRFPRRFLIAASGAAVATGAVQAITSPASAADGATTWKLGGNAAVSGDGSNFLGPKNVAPLIFKTSPTDQRARRADADPARRQDRDRHHHPAVPAARAPRLERHPGPQPAHQHPPLRRERLRARQRRHTALPASRGTVTGSGIGVSGTSDGYVGVYGQVFFNTSVWGDRRRLRGSSAAARRTATARPTAATACTADPPPSAWSGPGTHRRLRHGVDLRDLTGPASTASTAPASPRRRQR